jgi:hypothetical protein
MSFCESSGEVADNLKIKLTKGDGRVVYDSERDNKKPEFGFPDKPLKFCPDCGGATQAIIYMCKCCGQRMLQQQDKKTGRIMVMTLPSTEDPAKANP